MSKLFSKIANFFSSRMLVGVDKAGNRYFTRMEEIDGVASLSSEAKVHGRTALRGGYVAEEIWQHKEMLELEAYRERVRINVDLLKKEEERKSKGRSLQQSKSTGKVQSPDLKSFIQQFPGASLNERRASVSSMIPSEFNNALDAWKFSFLDMSLGHPPPSLFLSFSFSPKFQILECIVFSPLYILLIVTENVHVATSSA
ncbi:hypothetical protein Taro_048115 [Colocasia esculenta]|uniref:Uncharacterized protein n=1 Tax=Colocasia esculenta TaxID=4460 RepID=A0A843WXL5_COLES|nr:hypothetical protein [Colocasia esculenta]